MTILVIGSTGHVGSEVVEQLLERDADVHALSEHPARHSFPDGVTPVKGDLTDPESMRAALTGIRTLFLLNEVSPDELTRSLLTLNLAQEAGVERFVYLSMLNADVFLDTPHAAAKHGTEQMIKNYGLSAIVLRPTFFFQNDVPNKSMIYDKGVYPMPIGSVGSAMVDVRDIAEIAAIALVEQENASAPLPHEMIEIVGHDIFTGDTIAALWSEVLGKPVRYAGDDLGAFERQLKLIGPDWMAYDTALMFRGFQKHGMLAKPGAADRLAERLGRPLRTYRVFAEKMAEKWRNPSLGQRVKEVAAGTAIAAGKVAASVRGDA